MKLAFCSAILAFALISYTGTAQSAKNSLNGSWKLISFVGKFSGNSFSRDSTVIYQVKVVTPSRFVFTTYLRENDSLVMSAQGPIQVSGNTYTEIIEKSSNKGMVGKRYSYTSTINGNRWRIEGGGNGLELVEEWIRIE